jgi:predicted small secreted protein
VPPRALLIAVLLAALAVAGCTTTVAGTALSLQSGGADREMVTAYFTELNGAGEEGPTTQRDFLRRTQHPDFVDRLCDLGGLTVEIEPAMSTFRVDPEWKPEDAATRPRGLVYALGVFVSIRRDGARLAEQIGSQRVVVLEGKVYGFMACPTR